MDERRHPTVDAKAFDHRQQTVLVAQFRHERCGSDLQATALDVGIIHRRKHDDFDLRVHAHTLTTYFQSVDLGQIQIDHNHVGFESLRGFEHRGTVCDGSNDVTISARTRVTAFVTPG